MLGLCKQYGGFQQESRPHFQLLLQDTEKTGVFGACETAWGATGDDPKRLEEMTVYAGGNCPF